MNKVMLTGNLARDVEVKQTTNGKEVVTNAVAVRRENRADNGEYLTDFIEFTAWGQQAEFLGKYARKGDRVEIVGRWQVRTYTDDSGKNRRADECVVENISVFSRRQDAQDQAFTPPQAPAQTVAPAQAKSAAPAPKKAEPQGEQLKITTPWAGATPKPTPTPTPSKVIDDDDLPF